jgi:hypothetical protein
MCHILIAAVLLACAAGRGLGRGARAKGWAA